MTMKIGEVHPFCDLKTDISCPLCGYLHGAILYRNSIAGGTLAARVNQAEKWEKDKL